MAMVLGYFHAPLFGQMQDEIALVFLAAPPDDVAIFFQLEQQFTQGSGANMKPFQQLALTEASGCVENGKNVPLRVTRRVMVKMPMRRVRDMPARHPFGGAPEKVQQLLVATDLGLVGLRHDRRA